MVKLIKNNLFKLLRLYKFIIYYNSKKENGKIDILSIKKKLYKNQRNIQL